MDRLALADGGTLIGVTATGQLVQYDVTDLESLSAANLLPTSAGQYTGVGAFTVHTVVTSQLTQEALFGGVALYEAQDMGSVLV